MGVWMAPCIDGSWDGWLHSGLDGCVFTNATGCAAGILGNGRMDERIGARWMRLCQLHERQMFLFAIKGGTAARRGLYAPLPAVACYRMIGLDQWVGGWVVACMYGMGDS